MGERLKPAVLKTVMPERASGVRIPLPPPDLPNHFSVSTAPLSDVPALVKAGRSSAVTTAFAAKRLLLCGARAVRGCVSLEDELVNSGDGVIATFFVIEDDHLVWPSLQPVGRDEEALLRSDAPVAPKIVSIDPDESLSPPTHVHIGVSDPLKGEGPTIKGRSRLVRR